MGKRLVIFFIGVLSFSQIRAQSSLVIHGSIQDSSANSLSKSTIQLWNADDTVYALSRQDGQFSASTSNRSGRWMILVTMKGYKPYHSHFQIPENTKSFTLSPIILQAEYKELQPVIVLQEKPLTIKVDTLDYHAGAYVMREGSMLADLLKKLPGVRLNIDSSVTVMGKNISKVLVDGKDFFGADIPNAIRNLPYDIIDKVEIIDDYGDQARFTGIKAGEPMKVMNIVLRQDQRNGQFGSLEGGPGSHDQYTAAVVGNTFAGDRKFSLVEALTDNNPFGEEHVRTLKINYADTWSPGWSGSGEGGIFGSNHLFQNSMVQNSYFTGGHINLAQNNLTQGNRQQQYLNYEWLYAPQRNTKLRINTSFSNQYTREDDQVNLSSTESDGGFQKSTQSAVTNQSATRNTSAEFRLYFEQAYPRSGQRFSGEADVKYSQALQSGNSLTQSATIADSIPSQSLQQYRSNNDNTIWDIATHFHFYDPLGPKSFLESNYSLHQTINKSALDWMQPDSAGKSWQTVDSLSNDYIFRTLVQDFRTGFTRHGDKTDLDLGLIAEPGSLTGDSPDKSSTLSYHYFNLSPIVVLSYSLNKIQKIHLGYSTAITFPNLQEIQPVTNLSNPQYPVTGNPELKPAVMRSINLNFDQNSLRPTNYHGLGVGIDYTSIQNQAIPNIVHPKDTGTIIQQTYYTNINGNYILKLDWRFDLPHLLKKNLKLSGWGSLSENHGISMTDYTPFTTNTLGTSQNLSLQYVLPDQLEVNFYLTYNQSITRYSSNTEPNLFASTFAFGLNNRHYFLKNWTLRYEFIQSFTSGISPKLTAGPTILNIRLKRSFLRRKQLSCTLSGLNMLNANAGLMQTVTSNPTTITQNHANFIGRNMLFSIQWNFERFKHTLIR